ncbi:LysR family transcriptional regulator [Defluviimonas salinarum]|uniref:LysR substrate-binding domain-containing protein n=1 Tax=Defluviimonas salinarum TaxID=2992147 RepID=A0ABT3J5W6_9RHOB|nr:LysR substrate-binding domain-containing protein [Defluviimonas salinarum]MCW3783092.1 LysR substrate-binding domain-containing protein [Defluviimonas salinarum]
MAVKIDMMRCFRTVAQDGTLAAAAETLGRTPSAISMMLSQFEEHIGAALFETERKNRLTPLGLRVLEECDRALDAFDRSAEAIARHARSTAGTVRIAAVPSAALTLLPTAITAFRRERPDVRLEISDVDSASVHRRLQFDEADLGVASAAPGADVGGEVLLTDRLGIVCRSDSPILDGPPSWACLSRETLISNPLCALVDHPVVSELAAIGTLEARNTTALLAFVRRGLGATVLPGRVMDSEPPGIAFLAPADPVAERRLLVLANTRRQLSPAAAAFRAALVTAAATSASEQPRKLATTY